MNLRLAAMSDLAKLKEIYKKIIENMNENGIEIWDDIYPCEYFVNDINNNSLYVLTNVKEEILGAFALCSSNAGEKHVAWENNNANAMYLDRLGVNVDFCKQGIGTALLHYAMEIGKQNSAEYIRLFVIDVNKAAINLYKKNKFIQAKGVYLEMIDEDLTFNEYGFEKKISNSELLN